MDRTYDAILETLRSPDRPDAPKSRGAVLDVKLDRFCRRPIEPAAIGALFRDGEDLLNEFAMSYFYGVEDHPKTTDARSRIVAKLEEANRAYSGQARSNKGGAPPKYNWDDFFTSLCASRKWTAFLHVRSYSTM
jgi:hypothetical protein